MRLTVLFVTVYMYFLYVIFMCILLRILSWYVAVALVVTCVSSLMLHL